MSEEPEAEGVHVLPARSKRVVLEASSSFLLVRPSFTVWREISELISLSMAM